MALNTNFLLPGAFDQKKDDWKVYKEQMLFALQALGVENNLESARAIFLSQCGKDTFAFLSSLVAPKKLVEVNFDDILAVLDKFFAPEKSEILEAGKFHLRCQEKSEKMQSFISAIKAIAVHCNFSDLERQLRDRLVLGVRDVRLRRELLKTDNLTFAQAVSRSVQYEQTVSDLYPQTSTSTPLETKPTTSTSISEPMDTNLVNVGSQKRETACRHCGANHNPRGCKFARANCNYCKKVGHTVAVCWNRNKKKINLVEVEELDDSKEDFAYMNEILQVHVKSSAEQASSKIFTIIKLHDKEVQFEVDSGAARTVISYETWRNLQFKIKLEDANINLITWGRHPIKLKGLAKVKVGYKGLEHELTIIVAEDRGPNILGRNWFVPLGIQVEGLCWTSQVPEELQLKYPKVFSDQLGCYTGPPAKLILKNEAQPKFLKCRPIPYALREEVKTELKRLEAIGVLTPVRYSDWATPLRIVRKEDGTLRICGDYRSTVNISINCDVYPLPTSTEAFQLLAGGKSIFKTGSEASLYTNVSRYGIS
ncbi:uncharacterized protein K02A2.6-like [Cydia pomonella]|uniref:uncharacterized protein K02A2.6-like n=1 Tax=Cydia pomonella TaxID=82600 RepID=UPI002ADE4930|nr:uncharacterized protein K02A2.6-like [Cydia pomonella]